MHELPVTRSILGIVLRHAEANGVERVLSVDLGIPALSDLESEWLQSYFDRLSQGTAAEGAVLRVRRLPLTFLCTVCSREFAVTREELESAGCPACGGSAASVTAGTGYTVESMEVQ